MDIQKSKAAKFKPFKSESNNPAIHTPPTRFAKYLDRSGLTIVRLVDCKFEDAVSFYVKLQQSNPLFISLGLVGNQLQKYAEFVIKTGLKFPFNIVAIDKHSGRIEGACISVNVSEVDDSDLSGGARAHWKILYLAHKAMEEHVQYNITMSCVILGILPKYQGNKGLYMDLSTTHGDLCSEAGLDGFVAYTSNPNLLRAYQNMVSPGTKLPKVIAEKLLESNHSIVNNELLPRYRKAGILLADWEFLCLDLTTLLPIGITSKTCIVMAGPTPTTDYIALSRRQSRL
jgi:hypothetical protein